MSDILNMTLFDKSDPNHEVPVQFQITPGEITFVSGVSKGKEGEKEALEFIEKIHKAVVANGIGCKTYSREQPDRSRVIDTIIISC